MALRTEATLGDAACYWGKQIDDGVAGIGPQVTRPCECFRDWIGEYLDERANGNTSCCNTTTPPTPRPPSVMEFMSNVSSGLDEAKPSLFELISESQLRDLLEPSVRYVLAIATQRHPRYLIHIFNRFDEVYALSMLLVERHYLRKWGGTFTENFYGMKRERMIARDLPRAGKAVPDILSESTRLRGPDVWKSLFVIVRDTTVFGVLGGEIGLGLLIVGRSTDRSALLEAKTRRCV